MLNCPVVKFRKKNIYKFLLVHFKINKLKDAPPIPVRYAQAINGLKLDDEGLEFYTDRQPNPKLNKNTNYIGLCPGSKHFTKRWPKEYFLDLGKRFGEAGYTVLLFGGNEDENLCEEISGNLNPAINLCGNDDVLQTAADMKMCKVVYTNDSGLMHLAAALKVPVMAFFGSTVKEFGFSPYNAKSFVLEIEGLSCRPCTHIGRKSCPKKHFKCMKEISPATAFNCLRKLLTL
jgi:heptosyltransferase-2